MKKVVSILLIGLLALTGCTVSDEWQESLYLNDGLYLDGNQMSPPSYGALYEVSEAGTNIDMPDADTFYRWVSTTAGLTAGKDYVIASADSDTLTIGVKGAGVYTVAVAYSFSGTVNTLFEGAVFVNGVRQQNLEFNRFIGAGGDQGFAGIMGFVELNRGDVLDYRIMSDTMSATATTRHATLVINRVGR